MRIKQKLSLGFTGIALLIAVVGYSSVSLSRQIFGLRTVELPMEQNLRAVEVSIWRMIQAADSFRLSGDDFYEGLYNRQIANADDFFSKYKALTDTKEEKGYIEEFDAFWKEAKIAGSKMIELTKKQKSAEKDFFVNIDEADDVIDFGLQAKWSPRDPYILAKEQAIREVEVSIWEAIHAAQQYTGLTAALVRGKQRYLDAKMAAVAAATASLVKGDFKDLMEVQFRDVDEFWGKYKALPHKDFEDAAIREFEAFWKKAVIAGREVVSLHDQVKEQFNILFDKIYKASQVLDFKMQEFIQKRVDRQDAVAARLRIITIAVMLFAFTGALGAGLIIARSISDPIARLKDAASQIGKGKFGTKVAITSKDEIGFLTDSFNKMAEQLAAGEQQLKASESALKNKVEELESLNKLMIGRELKMIELKKEINKLLKELGRDPLYEVGSQE